MMTNINEEQIFIGDENGNPIELTGKDKEAFLEQRAKDRAEQELFEAKYEERKQQKAAILERIGLTEEELQIVLGA
jgi:hypothetical protein